MSGITDELDFVASKITGEEIKDFLRLDEDADERRLERMRDMAISHILKETNQTKDYLDAQPEMCHAVLVLVQDMHDNRSMYVDNKKVNEVVRSIIQSHIKMTL